jgi:hypothetical protein
MYNQGYLYLPGIDVETPRRKRLELLYEGTRLINVLDKGSTHLREGNNKKAGNRDKFPRTGLAALRLPKQAFPEITTRRCFESILWWGIIMVAASSDIPAMCN